MIENMEISFIIKAYWLDCEFLNPDVSEPGKVIIGSLILMNNLVINSRHFVLED